MEELARVVVPVVMGRIGGIVERYDGTRERLVGTAPARWSDAQLAALEASDDEGRALGFAMGVLAAATGADVLVARREAAGARILVGLVADAVGRGLDPPASGLPSVGTRAGAGWEAPFALASLVLAAARAADERTPLAWRLESEPGAWRIALTTARSRPVGKRAAALAAAFPQLRATSDGLRLPAAWLDGGSAP